jgi:hypothetical protein
VSYSDTDEFGPDVYVSADKARDLVCRGAQIRVHSGAIGCEDIVMAEGKVIAYCPAPSLTIEHADGTRSSWSVGLPITDLSQPTT